MQAYLCFYSHNDKEFIYQQNIMWQFGHQRTVSLVHMLLLPMWSC